ncbi:hypothetical protein FTX61_13880 [Nitriliruptoraceae bacterium ZYF776]|nr:hypothetical protein [Profundirhabdus halotolerans]
MPASRLRRWWAARRGRGPRPAGGFTAQSPPAAAADLSSAAGGEAADRLDTVRDRTGAAAFDDTDELEAVPPGGDRADAPAATSAPTVRVHRGRLERGVGPLELSPTEAVRLAEEGPRALRRELPPDAPDEDPLDGGRSDERR